MWHYFDDEDLAAVKQVLDSGNLSAIGGAVTTEFGNAFAKEFGSPIGIANCNAMAGLHCAVAATGVEPGDEVIVDPMVSFASLAVYYHNGIPIYADVRPDTHTMDPASFAERITNRTKAVIVTQLWGLIADMDEIIEIAHKHGIVVIEDCAHAIYATYNGQYAGTIGDFGIFSFQMSKQMALGDCGMLLCKTEEHAHEVGRMMNFGTIPDRIGWNYRTTEVMSAIGLIQLKRARHYVDICCESAAGWNDAVAGYEQIVRPQYVPGNRVNTYHLWAATYEGDKAGLPYDDFKTLCAEAGWDFMWGYIQQPAYLHPTLQEPVGYGKGCPRMCPFADRNPVYEPGLCPVAEDLMPRMMLVYTGGDPVDICNSAARFREEVLERI